MKATEVRAAGYKPELMERPDCLLHRLDAELFPGFAGLLQEYLGVKRYMMPSYLRASALAGRAIILSWWDSIGMAEVNTREAEIMQRILRDEPEVHRKDEEFVETIRIGLRLIDVHPTLEPYKKRYDDYSRKRHGTHPFALRNKETRRKFEFPRALAQAKAGWPKWRAKGRRSTSAIHFLPGRVLSEIRTIIACTSISLKPIRMVSMNCSSSRCKSGSARRMRCMISASRVLTSAIPILSHQDRMIGRPT